MLQKILSIAFTVLLLTGMVSKTFVTTKQNTITLMSLENTTEENTTAAADEDRAPWSNAAEWALPELQSVLNNGLYPNVLNESDLTQSITRAEFAAVAVRLYETLSGTDVSPASETTFLDTINTDVLKAYALGITKGIDDVSFAPNAYITREAAVTMLTRVYKALIWEGWTLDGDSNYTAHSLDNKGAPYFVDYNKISVWAKPSVYFMTKYEIVKGTGANFFGPQGTNTRQEALLYTLRLYNNLTANTFKDAGPDPLGQDYVISWVDPAFSSHVRQGLNKLSGDIWRSDLDGINTLNIYGNNFIKTNLFSTLPSDVIPNVIKMGSTGISDKMAVNGLYYDRGKIKIDDLINFKNLKSLTIMFNKINDISVIGSLSGLTSLYLLNNHMSSDISSVTNLINLHDLYLENCMIKDLSPLKNLINLQNLNLWGNQISDITPLKYLINLNFLALDSNQIYDISPLSSLTNLGQLSLQSNRISDLNALSNLSNIWQLNLSGNNINNLSPLAKLQNLYTLSFDGAGIKDLSPLAGLTSLRYLSAMGTQVSNLSPLAGLKSLCSLNLNSNLNQGKIKDITPLSNLIGLTSLSLGCNQITDLSPLSGLTSLSYLDLQYNQIKDITPLKNLIKLYTLRLGNNIIIDLTPLSSLIELNILQLDNNRIKDLTPLSGLTKLNDLSLSGNYITDWSPVANVPSVYGRP